MKYEDVRLTILSEEWSILFRGEDDDDRLKDNDGYTDNTIKTIVICKERKDSDVKNQDFIIRAAIRHEIIHAFLFESGLEFSSLPAEHWAVNEEMVDWMAHMHGKIHAAFQEAKAL